jgi:two-component system chemotaxis response regulator CheY
MSLKDRLQVMVVDDMSTSRGLITQALDQIGIVHYQTENNGELALNKLIARPVHLVISDYNMPGLDGLQVLDALRRHQATQRIGFILITGKASKEVIEKGRQLAMNNFLRKPFSAQDLKICIERVVGKL